MGRVRQTVERTQLGLALLRLRTAAKKSQQEAAEAVGRTAARISQVENGKGTLGGEELTKLLIFYGVTGTRRDTLLALGRASRRRQRGHGFVDLLPESYQRLTDMLAATDAIRWYECGLVPGLVQSPDYVAAMIRTAATASSEAEVQERIAFRLAQQKGVLDTADSKTIEIVFTEDALRHVIGDHKVMRGQILHMLQLVERHPSVSLRVVPDSAHNNPALGGGLIIVGTSTPISFAPPLYGPSTYYDQPRDTEPMQRIFDRVRDLALSSSDTRKLLLDVVRKDIE